MWLDMLDLCYLFLFGESVEWPNIFFPSKGSAMCSMLRNLSQAKPSAVVFTAPFSELKEDTVVHSQWLLECGECEKINHYNCVCQVRLQKVFSDLETRQ